ncbi:MAG: flagellar assembly protein A [Myxococcota bacterium]|nr:flagellar assembly protein A [Myxococcota bacterium]
MRAKNESEALEGAAELLYREVDELEVLRSRKGQFHVGLRFVEARLTFALSEDHRVVVIQEIDCPKEAQKPSVGTVTRQLSLAGVVVGVNREAIAGVLEGFAEGEMDRQTPVALAEEPTQAIVGGVRLVEETESVAVVAGSLIGEWEPRSEARPGRDVFGNPIDGDVDEASQEAQPGPGCRLEDGRIYATRYGRVRQTPVGEVEVVSGLNLDADRGEVRMNIWPTVSGRGPVTVVQIRDILAGLQIAEPCVNLENIRAAVKQAWSDNDVVENVVVARSLPPLHGTPQRLALAREVGSFVHAGEEVLMQRPAQAARDGMGLFGEVVAARERVESAELAFGDGLSLSRDKVRVVATGAGSLRRKGDSFFLEPAVRISADGLSAFVDLPPMGSDGEALQEEEVLGWLEDHGIVAEFIDEGGLRRGMAAAIRSGTLLENCLVAVGRPPVEAWDAEFRPVPVTGVTAAFPGDELAQVDQAEPAEPGMSVLGERILADASSSAGERFRVGKGCVEKDGRVIATTYGQVRINKKGVSVEQGWSEDEQEQTLRLRVFQKRIGGQPVSLEALLGVLLEEGFVEECLNKKRIAQALRQKSTVDVVVGQARQPENPTDATLEMAGLSTGFPVFPGDRIAHIHPGEPGKPGRTLRGEPIVSPYSPRKISLMAGDFCMSPDQGQSLVSQAYGMARVVSEQGPPGDLRIRMEVESALSVDESRQSCRMDIFPESSSGAFTGVEQLVSVLRNSGIIEACVDREAIAHALATSRGNILKGVLVAYGRQPSPGEDWEVTRHVSPGPTVVFPGDCIAEVNARIPPEPGFDLEGRALLPDLQEVGMALQAKQHCQLSEDGRAVHSSVYGRAEVNGLEVRVVPGFRLSPSDFRLMMDVFPARADGRRIAHKELVEQVLALGVQEEFLQEERLSEALRLAWESESPQWHVEVACGREPVDGKDGVLEALQPSEGAIVFPGDPVVRIVPERQPVSGRSVFGAEIPGGQPVKAAKVNVESGCERVGEDLVVATVYGRPFVDGSRVMVQPGIYVSADGMRLSMDIVARHSSGERINADELCSALVNQGFDESLIPREKLQAALDDVENRGGIHWDFEVGVGVPPIEGRNGHPVKDWHGECGVFPGEIFARFVPHVEGIPGKTVDGRLIRPQTTVEETRIRVGSGSRGSPDGLWAQAEVYGEPILGEEGASVLPGVRISEDGHEVRMDIWPYRMDGEATALSDLREQLLRHGVDPSVVDDNALAEGLREATDQTRVCRDVVVAQSRKAQEGADGAYELLEDRLNTCVFAGDRFGRIVPPVLPEMGLNVLGKTIPPERGVHAFQFQLKDGLRWDEDAGEIVVEVYGRIEVARGRVTEQGGFGIARTESLELWVEKGIRFNDSRLSAYMDIYPQRLGGEAVESADLVAVLESHGVEKEALLERAVQSGRRAAARQWSPQENLRVARGTLPKHGRDGRLKVELESAVQAGERGAFGRIDFREQNSFLEVKEGELLAHIMDPTRGVAGRTVTGEVIEARDGADGAVEFGAGVVVRESEAYAARDGVLTVRGAFMDVVELLVIDGDVDYRTGHVRVAQGSVKISGSVLPGFEVSCPDDVEVGEVVEGATIEAGGNVVVRGGVVSGVDSGSIVRAGGEITVGLARNATLEAKGSVLVQKELLHCEVITEERLLADRKPGVVSGGQIRARAGAVVCQLGSAQWTPTVLRVGGLPEQVEFLQKELGARRRQRIKFHDLLGGLPDHEALAECLPEERPRVETLCAQRAELRAEVVALEQKLALHLAQWEAEPTVMVTVKQNLFPRVVLNFPQAQFIAEHQVSRSRFFLDSSGRNVDVLDLGAELPGHVNPRED